MEEKTKTKHKQVVAQKWDGKEEYFVRPDGIREGVYTKYHLNENKWKEGLFKDGKKTGIWTEYYPSGQKRRETKYRAGKKHGVRSGWYNDDDEARQEGPIMEQDTFVDGRKEGISMVWFENTRLREQKTYQAGVLGTWTLFDTHGSKREF